MKKIVIGITFLLSGLITILALVLTAADYLPHLTAWSNSYPSKVLYLIFSGMSP